MAASAKTERLLNLVICLLHTRQFLGVQRIRELVPGYEQAGEEAFRRMFERDKEDLRDLGIPLETGTSSAAFDDELGYRIARRDYELPPLSLAPDEAAAVGLASQLWQSGPLASATSAALRKLKAAGVDAPVPSPHVEPRVVVREPAFDRGLEGVRDSRPVRFGYRKPGQDAVEQREVEPWGVLSWHGRWYLVGLDRVRGAERVFRLSRVVGEVEWAGDAGAYEVPPGHDLRAALARLAGDEPSATAVVRVRAGTCWALRREAAATRPEGEWDVLDVPFGDAERLAAEVVAHGPDAVAVEPPELRAAVVRRLEALAATAAGGGS